MTQVRFSGFPECGAQHREPVPAGDLRVQLTRQVTTAVGDATTAAIAVEKYLTERRQSALGVGAGAHAGV
jgi:hypothetical protein